MENLFEDLFVLELSNNHLGDYNRAKELIVRCADTFKSLHGIKAAIKFQLRDAKNFVHKDYRARQDIRYVRKVLDTILEDNEYEKLYTLAKEHGFLTAATPFDETGVAMCQDFDLDIVKIASSDIKNVSLLKSVAMLNKPTIVSLGGADIEDIDNIVSFFQLNNIPLALNHCVSLYPCPDEDLNLEKIIYLNQRYPGITIGFSTHQTNDNLEASICAACALGAKTIERHIDIEFEGKMRHDYTTSPEDIKKIINSYFLAKNMLSSPPSKKITLKEKERNVLEKFTRGVYAKTDLQAGNVICENDFYYACPYLNGQLCHNDIVPGMILSSDVKKDEPILEISVKINTRI